MRSYKVPESIYKRIVDFCQRNNIPLSKFLPLALDYVMSKYIGDSNYYVSLLSKAQEIKGKYRRAKMERVNAAFRKHQAREFDELAARLGLKKQQLAALIAEEFLRAS